MFGSVENRNQEPFGNRAMRGMFADRKSVFVDLLKWNLPVLDGRFELDQFDNGHADYVIIADIDGDHLGSARLLPSTRPHILDSMFAHLCAGPVPRGPGIAEITRFCLSRRQNAAQRRLTCNRLVTALVQRAFESNIHTYTGVAEIGWLQRILAFGWDCRPLGIPVRSACGTLGALQINIEADTPDLLAANGIWEEVADGADLVPEAA